MTIQSVLDLVRAWSRLVLNLKSFLAEEIYMSDRSIGFKFSFMVSYIIRCAPLTGLKKIRNKNSPASEPDPDVFLYGSKNGLEGSGESSLKKSQLMPGRFIGRRVLFSTHLCLIRMKSKRKHKNRGKTMPSWLFILTSKVKCNLIGQLR